MGCVSACFFFHLLSAFCEEASMRVLVRCRMSSVLPLSVEPRTSTFASLMTPGEQENRPDERMGARGSGPASLRGCKLVAYEKRGKEPTEARSETHKDTTKSRDRRLGDKEADHPRQPGSLGGRLQDHNVYTPTRP